jgi:iron complex outermembrane receptor protein
MRSFVFFSVCSTALLAQSVVNIAQAEDADDSLDEVIVSATLRPQSLLDTVYSATVLDSNTLKDAGQQHFQDVLGLVPNLSWSAGTSRPRFFQIRGIGELDQYQGAPNPYVGFVIDDIDVSGVGGLATLYDIRQIEVLRGPQAITFGANAIAGLINVQSNEARPEFELSTEETLANYRTAGFSGTIGGALDQNGDAFRIVAQRYRSDGFRHNLYLNRYDTNGLDESTLRGKLKFKFGAWQLKFTGIYVDQDNGYDAWSIDNSFNTQSDYPGRDTQRTKAIAANLQYDGWSAAKLESISTYSAVDVTYSFDDDWGNNSYWLDTTGYSPYSYYSDITRKRTVRTQELRISSKTAAVRAGQYSWVAGAYVRNLREANNDVEFAQDVSYDSVGSAAVADSDYGSTNVAVYASDEYGITDATTINSGIRVEQRRASYEDSDTPKSPVKETLWGANMSLLHHWSKLHASHLDISRGYRAGGVNIGSQIPDSVRLFKPEYLWNLEVGDRATWFNSRISTDVSVFYMARKDMQVSSSMQDPGNPAAFIFITGNAASGKNYGAEFTSSLIINDNWKVFGTASWLHSQFDHYQYVDKYTGELHVLDGRQQPHAPSYQFSLGLDWHRSGWMARVDVSGKSSFYFETSSDEASHAYQLVNAKLGYEESKWSIHGWIRNALDKRYETRGFFFGDEPPNFDAKRYIQNGDPRQIGVTVSLKY